MKKAHAPVSAAPGQTRRTFLRRSLSAAAVLSVPDLIPGRALGKEGAEAAGERVTVGLIGCGCMGSGHLQRLAYDARFQLVAVCDVDQTRREAAKARTEAIYAATQPKGSYRGCEAYRDYRDVLARPDIDAILIATPDHWHALQSIDAAKAGKDIYCEKPVSMTLQEGRRVVETVRRYGRVFQTGTQYRSIPSIRKVCQFIRDGRLGKVKSVFTLYQPLSYFFGERYKAFNQVLNIERCGKSYVPLDFALPGEPVPAGLDWDLWVGPAPWRPYNHLYHINPSPGVVPWSFSDAFGVTSSTWFLSHAADVIQWALGMENSGPVEILHPASDAYPTLTLRYSTGVPVHFVEHWGQVKELYHAVPAGARLEGNFGGVFVGERGWVTTLSAGGQVEGEPESLFEEMQLRRGPGVSIGSNTHHANWLECIRTRQAPSANAEIGHRAASVGHLANIACWTGTSLKWDPQQEVFLNAETANRMRARTMRAPWKVT